MTHFIFLGWNESKAFRHDEGLHRALHTRAPCDQPLSMPWEWGGLGYRIRLGKFSSSKIRPNSSLSELNKLPKLDTNPKTKITEA